MRLKSLSSLALLAAAAVTLPGCAPTVVNATAPLQNAAGAATGNVRMTFVDDRFNTGNVAAKAVSSDGETFTGKVVQENVATSAQAIGSAYGSKKETAVFGGSGSSTAYGASASAVLTGDKGHSMSCGLKFNDANEGVSSGGVGECSISDGRKIPVTF
jgi:hypothetical protein